MNEQKVEPIINQHITYRVLILIINQIGLCYIQPVSHITPALEPVLESPPHLSPTMTNTSKHFPSISSFISHTTSQKQPRFPQQQITQYCKQNDCSYQKICNIYQSYYQRFRWNYDNYNEIVVLLGIALKRVEIVKIDSSERKEECGETVRIVLAFLEDLITSKMLLVCLASKNRPNSIYHHFLFTKGLLNLLVPQVLTLELHSQLIDMIEKCNTSTRARSFIPINFLVEFMLISTTIDFLSEQSERKFKSTVMSLLQNKKKTIANLLWNIDKQLEKRVQFRQIAYLRLDIESPRINFLQLTNDGKLTTNQKNYFQPQQWIVEAYQRSPSISVWKNIRIQNVIDIYQFLFKLEVFASSPQIEELDSLIPNSDQFMDVFSKFLMGEDLIEKTNRKDASQSTVIRDISQIKRLYEGATKNYKNLLKKELSKIFSQTESEEDKENATGSQVQIDQ